MGGKSPLIGWIRTFVFALFLFCPFGKKLFTKSPELKSNFSVVDYAGVENRLDSSTNHIEMLCEYIRQNIFPYIDKGNFLDVGAGPGFVTQEFVEAFDWTIALDPNPCYAKNYRNLSNNYGEFKNQNFEFAAFDRRFDFILCSHVLYHIPQRNWKKFVQKMRHLLTKNGRALVVIIGDRGEFHELCKTINPNYSHSKVLQTVLEEADFLYKIAKVSAAYFHKDFKEFIDLLKIFVLDDCFLPEEYASLSEKQKIAINEKILHFAEGCYREDLGLYVLKTEEDYIELNAH